MAGARGLTLNAARAPRHVPALRGAAAPGGGAKPRGPGSRERSPLPGPSRRAVPRAGACERVAPYLADAGPPWSTSAHPRSVVPARRRREREEGC